MSANGEKPPFGRVYMRGVFDGLRRAGIDDVEGFMNAARRTQLEKGLTGIAHKVFDAVPISDAWQANTIANEIKRQTGSAPELKIVNGCLESLKQAGLVREQVRGKFIRTPVREREESGDSDPVNVVELRASKKQEGNASCSPREALSDISACLIDIAARIEDVANEIDSNEKKNHESAVKLKQLQELLRGIG